MDNKENIFLSKNISKCERPQRMELQKANQLHKNINFKYPSQIQIERINLLYIITYLKLIYADYIVNIY